MFTSYSSYKPVCRDCKGQVLLGGQRIYSCINRRTGLFPWVTLSFIFRSSTRSPARREIEKKVHSIIQSVFSIQSLEWNTSLCPQFHCSEISPLFLLKCKECEKCSCAYRERWRKGDIGKNLAFFNIKCWPKKIFFFLLKKIHLEKSINSLFVEIQLFSDLGFLKLNLTK